MCLAEQSLVPHELERDDVGRSRENEPRPAFGPFEFSPWRCGPAERGRHDATRVLTHRTSLGDVTRTTRVEHRVLVADPTAVTRSLESTITVDM